MDCRLREEVAYRALAGLVMDGALHRVTGTAEAARGRQLLYRCAFVAGIAPPVRDLGRRMRAARLGNAMTGGAVPVDGVVLGVAVTALRLFRREGERDRRRVAFDAVPRGMLRVHEFHIPRIGRVTGHGDRDGLRLRGAVLRRLVACRASRLPWRLMVADRAPARPLEGEAAVSRSGLVTDEAGDPLMTRVREAVGCRGWRREMRRVLAGIGDERTAAVRRRLRDIGRRFHRKFDRKRLVEGGERHRRVTGVR